MSATGPAWAALVASTRTSEHGAQVYRDAYEAGRADASAGLGRARYRRAVVSAIIQLDYIANTGRRRACGYTMIAGRDHALFLALCDRYMWRHERAAARARRILAALDGAR